MAFIPCSVVLLLLCYTEAQNARHVPALFWNIKGNSLHSHPIPAFEETSPKHVENFIKEILEKKSTTMLVYLIERLSLEDFSVELPSAMSNNTLGRLVEFADSHPHVFLPSMEDPVERLHDVNCGIEEVYLDKTVDLNFFQSISPALKSSCVLILHLLGSEIMKSSDSVGEFFQPTLSTSKKNVVGMFSASKSSWANSKKAQKISRNLLSVTESDDNFVSVGNCSIMYAENSTVSFGQSSNKTISLVFPPGTEGSSCGNGTSSLVLTFPTEEGSKGIVLSMEFNRTISGWRLIQSMLSIDDEETELSVEELEAPDGFSYSCGNFVLKAKNSTKSISVTMNSFQVQPFDVNGPFFDDSFDCVPFFTLPIWMGLFVSILFITILNTGIYALFSVKTMDRFDDPKGKTISVSAAMD